MTAEFISHDDFIEYSLYESRIRANAFYADVKRRRTIREFSDRPVPRDLIETCLLAAGTAPNGANLQPWHFVIVSDAQIKQQIRVAAEEEERHVQRLRSHPAHAAIVRSAAQPRQQPGRRVAGGGVEVHGNEGPDRITVTTHRFPGAEAPPRARSRVGPSSSSPSTARRTQSSAA